MPETLALAAEFDSVTRDQWRELVAGVLRKAGREDLPEPVEDALSRTVATGVRIAPLYTAEDAGDLPSAVGVPGLAPFVRGARAGAHPESGVPAGWDVRQRHAHPDVAVTKEAIAADLENGVTSLWLVLGEGAIPVDALGEVLYGVLLDLAPVTVQGGRARPPRRSSPWCEGRTDLAPGGSLGLDPLGLQAASGAAAGPVGPGGRRPPRSLRMTVCGRSSSTRPSSPTRAPRPSRSSAARSPPVSPTCGRSPTAG